MGRPPVPEYQRFFQAVLKQPSGCWEWQRGLDKDGYGRIKIGSSLDGTRRTVKAHRWSYEHHVGPIPEGMQIDHLCRNRRCVNPAHLEPVTGLENAQRGLRKTKPHCKNGHLLAGANLYIRPGSGHRTCKICNRRSIRHRQLRTKYADWRKYYYRHREKLLAAKAEYRAKRRKAAAGCPA